MSVLQVMTLALAPSLGAFADTIVYQQSPNPAGGLLQSSWWSPDDSDWDQWVWDNFTLAENRAITQVFWRGG